MIGSALFAVLGILAAEAPLVVRVKAPIAVAALSGTGLAVLSETAVVRVDTAGATGEELIRLTDDYVPVDIASAVIEGTEFLFVTASQDVRRRKSSVVLRFPVAEPHQLLVTPMPIGMSITGISFDQRTGLLYAADSDSGRIFQYRCTRNELVASGALTSIRDAMSLGSLAVDSGANRLYAVDPTMETLYSIDLDSGKYRIMRQDLGMPSTLGIDLRDHTVYVGAGRKLFALPPGNAAGHKRPLADRFNEISGVTVDGNHRVWVVDYGAGRVQGPF